MPVTIDIRHCPFHVAAEEHHARSTSYAPFEIVSGKASWLDRVMLHGGKALGFAAIPVALFGIFTYQDSKSFLEQLMGPFGLAMLLSGASTLMISRATQALQPSADEQQAADRRPPIVLLRSFRDDDASFYTQTSEHNYEATRLEEAVAEHFLAYGPFLTIGKPGEAKPKLGAGRRHARGDWRVVVTDWMDQALILLVVPGTGAGLAWELETLVERHHARKLLVLMPPESKPLFSRGKPDPVQQRWESLRTALVTSPYFADLPTIAPSGLMAMHLGANDEPVFIIGPNAPMGRHYRKAVQFGVYGMHWRDQASAAAHISGSGSART
jgi:hypothetical protein